jgi:hypothetical protein
MSETNQRPLAELGPLGDILLGIIRRALGSATPETPLIPDSVTSIADIIRQCPPGVRLMFLELEDVEMRKLQGQRETKEWPLSKESRQRAERAAFKALCRKVLESAKCGAEIAALDGLWRKPSPDGCRAKREGKA